MKRSRNEVIKEFIEALNLELERWKDLLPLDRADAEARLIEDYKNLLLGDPNSHVLTAMRINDSVEEYREGLVKKEFLPLLDLLRDTKKNVYPVFKRREIAKAFNRYDADAKVFRLSEDTGFPTSEGIFSATATGDFLRSLINVIPILNEDDEKIKLCKQCSQFMLARGKIKDYCSDACRYKAFPKRPYDPKNESIKHYRKWYQKLVVRAGITLEDFRKEYKTILENEEKEKKSHGKKTKSK
ncbi:MAG: hypothetical protein ACYDBV_02610 [Nitrospiria bacterium]